MLVFETVGAVKADPKAAITAPWRVSKTNAITPHANIPKRQGVLTGVAEKNANEWLQFVQIQYG